MFRRSLLLSFLIITAVGCSSNRTEDPGTKGRVKIKGITDPALSPQEKAERLAKAAEQLISFQGFVYANDVADLALQADPANVRAGFVKALIGPIMVHRGIYARVAPLAARDPKFKAEYDKEVAKFEANFPNSTIKTFLFEGSGDIKTEADVQAYLDTVVDTYKNLRDFAKANKSVDLTVMTSDTFYPAMIKRFKKGCVVRQIGEWEWEYDCPSPVHMLEVNLTRGDWEGVQQIAAGLELYHALWNSYDVAGAVQVAINHKDNAKKPSPQVIIDELLKDPKFATLRATHAFQKINAMGADAILGLRWVMNNQNTLCPLGSKNPRNRLGALFDEGLCVEKPADVGNGIKIAENALAGQEVAAHFTGPWGASYTTMIKPAATINTPINDLRVLTPVQLDRCNRLSGVKDQTVGGFFPKNDANTVLQVTSRCF